MPTKGSGYETKNHVLVPYWLGFSPTDENTYKFRHKLKFDTFRYVFKGRQQISLNYVKVVRL